DGARGSTGKGTGTGTRRPGTRGTRRAPGAVSRGMAGRFPCHLCLAVSVIFPADGLRWEHSQGGLNRENHLPLPPMLPADTLGDRDFRYAAGGRGRRPVTRAIAAPAGARGSSGPWPGWRQVALMGRTDQRIRSSEEGFRTMSAVSSESHEPAVEPGQPAAPEHATGQADFGANEWLVEELYQRYLADP